jgi:hypothetical protein
MASIEKRLFRAWKKRRGMRLTAEEVDLLMRRGLQYLARDVDAAPRTDQFDHSTVAQSDDSAPTPIPEA